MENNNTKEKPTECSSLGDCLYSGRIEYRTYRYPFKINRENSFDYKLYFFGDNLNCMIISSLSIHILYIPIWINRYQSTKFDHADVIVPISSRWTNLLNPWNNSLNHCFSKSIFNHRDIFFENGSSYFDRSFIEIITSTNQNTEVATATNFTFKVVSSISKLFQTYNRHLIWLTSCSIIYYHMLLNNGSMNCITHLLLYIYITLFSTFLDFLWNFEVWRFLAIVSDSPWTLSANNVAVLGAITPQFFIVYQ